MKRVLIFSSLGVVGLAGGSAAVWQSVDRELKANSNVGEVAVGKLKREEAAKKLREWWLTHKLDPITVTVKGKVVAKTNASDLGLTLDDAASIAQVPEEGGLTQAIGGGQEASATTYPLLYAKVGTPNLKAVAAAVAKTIPAPAPARVRFSHGQIVRVAEAARKELDLTQLADDGAAALKDGKTTVEAPLKEAPKKITDEMLAGITDVVSEFSTRFSAGNVPRASNIKLAASKIDGVLLLPGEVFSYNDTVGRRTLKAGFRVAGVYINGKHDSGVGGGICQVSTTLYNASLFANLGVLERQNHSLPVPYVPVGRDATVDYGNIDLKIKNTMTTPIVISSTYVPGRLTFRILGKKDPGVSVSIASSGVRYGGMRTERVVDRSLPAGATKIVERGSSAMSCSTTRVVKKDGHVVRREGLGGSYYTGGKRVIAYNPDRPKPKALAPTVPASGAPGVIIDPEA